MSYDFTASHHFTNFYAPIALYAKSKAKDKTPYTKKIIEYIKGLHGDYDTTPSKILKKHLQRTISVYSTIAIKYFVAASDYKALEMLIDTDCAEPSEIIILSCIYFPERLEEIVDSVKDTKGHLVLEADTYQRISTDMSCNQLSELVSKIQEEAIEEAEKVVKKQKKEKLSKLQKMMKELNLSKEDLEEL